MLLLASARCASRRRSAMDGSSSHEPLEREPLEAFTHGVELDRLDDLSGERVCEQLPGERVRDAAALEIEQRGLIDLADRRAVRALHVVGEDLQLRLAV